MRVCVPYLPNEKDIEACSRKLKAGTEPSIAVYEWNGMYVLADKDDLALVLAARRLDTGLKFVSLGACKEPEFGYSELVL